MAGGLNAAWALFEELTQGYISERQIPTYCQFGYVRELPKDTFCQRGFSTGFISYRPYEMSIW
jgi:hypothetical protein